MVHGSLTAPSAIDPARPLQRFGGDGSFAVDPAQVGLMRSGGSPLPGALLAKMEAAFGADFSGVRVHVGPQAARIGALAFTTGDDLYFAPGQFQPDSVKGQQLIGHELAHVVQQRQGRVRGPASGVAVVHDRLLEAEADRLGMRAASLQPKRSGVIVTPAPRGAATGGTTGGTTGVRPGALQRSRRANTGNYATPGAWNSEDDDSETEAEDSDREIQRPYTRTERTALREAGLSVNYEDDLADAGSPKKKRKGKDGKPVVVPTMVSFDGHIVNYTKYVGRGKKRTGPASRNKKRKRLVPRIDNRVYRGHDPDLSADAILIHDEEPEQVYSKAQGMMIDNETRAATTIVCAIFVTESGEMRKYCFCNAGALMKPKLRKKAHELGYHVVKSLQAHAEGEMMLYSYTYKRKLLRMGCDKPHCAECSYLMDRFYGGIDTDNVVSGETFKKYIMHPELKKATGLNFRPKKASDFNKKSKGFGVVGVLAQVLAARGLQLVANNGDSNNCLILAIFDALGIPHNQVLINTIRQNILAAGIAPIGAMLNTYTGAVQIIMTALDAQNLFPTGARLTVHTAQAHHPHVLYIQGTAPRDLHIAFANAHFDGCRPLAPVIAPPPQ